MLLHGTTRETLGWLARDLAEAWAVPRGAEFAALDPRALRALAQEWVLRFARLLEEARAREAEAAALMSSSLAAGFWDARDRAQDTLRRYKDLDARIQADRRLARPVARTSARITGPPTPARTRRGCRGPRP